MQIAADLSDRYGPIPHATEQLVRMLQLKLVAKQLGFSRIKPEGKQHVVLETPMEGPAWNCSATNPRSPTVPFCLQCWQGDGAGVGGAQTRKAA
jgi:hypothetical protein